MTRRYRWLLGFVSVALVLAFVSGCCKCPPVPPSPPPVEKEVGMVVKIGLKSGKVDGPFPREVRLSRGERPDADHVRWFNASGAPITLTFTKWPFMGPEQPIVIPDGAFSAWFTLNRDLPSGGYAYQADPPFPPGPPGDPAIVEEP